jgi:hypothetical protein
VVFVIVPLTEEDRAHAAATELPDQPVRTNAGQLSACDTGFVEQGERVLDPMLKETAACVVARQQ